VKVVIDYNSTAGGTDFQVNGSMKEGGNYLVEPLAGRGILEETGGTYRLK
jgi:hypothetical protein